MSDIDEAIRTIYDDEKKQRVTIFRRKNGCFGFVEEYFSQHQIEMCWVPHRKDSSFFNTLETALREVYSRVDWLIGKGSLS